MVVLASIELKFIDNIYAHEAVVHHRNFSLPYCKNNEYIAGFWERMNSTSPSKSFYCCGWDYKDYQSNSDKCGYGNYNYNSGTYIGSNHIYAHSGGHACSCDAISPLGRNKINEREMYVWKPAYCDLLDWNATLFCQLLGTKTIALIGDSTMEQTATTLMNMIRHNNGGCAHQIRLCRTDFLVSVTHPGKELNAMEYIELYKPSIAIFNYGAHGHIMSDIESTWKSFVPMLKRIKKLFPNIQLVWKSQNTGHLFCANHSDNVHHPNIIYDPIHGSHGADYYKWYNFPGFDEVSRNYTLKLNISMKFIDMSPLNFRIDAHARPAMDCLHYCLPGPINLFSILLLQMLYNQELY